MTCASCVSAATQLQQDPNDPNKWQLVATSQPSTTTLAPSPSSATPSPSDNNSNNRRLRRVACTCPNCQAEGRSVLCVLFMKLAKHLKWRRDCLEMY